MSWIERLTSLAALGGAFVLTASSASAQCGDAVGYVPTPESRDGARLWPAGLSPADPPGVRVAADRDSTAYDSRVYPAAVNGLELFWAIDATEGFAFVGYNVGLSVWDLAGPLPRRVAFADHIRGDWFGSHISGEPDGYLTGIAAERDPISGLIAVAVSSLAPVGISFWSFDPAGGALVQHYQDADATLDAYGESQAVSLAAHDGRLYAFSAANVVLEAFDVSAALASSEPCGDRPRGTCPGIALGSVGPAGRPGMYVDALAVPGALLVATAAGADVATQPFPTIRRLTDPGEPGSATTVWTGPRRGMAAPQLFALGGASYLALADGGAITVHPVGACTTAADCVEEPVATHAIEDRRGLHVLRYSTSDGRGVLYHTMTGVAPGTAPERVIDLGALGTGTLVDLAGGGASYVEACAGRTVSYFQDGHAQNEHGFRNVVPMSAIAHEGALYRVAVGVFDVHTLRFAEPPVDIDAGAPEDAGMDGDGSVDRSDGGAIDASLMRADSGPPSAMVASCSCRAGAAPRSSASFFALGLALALALMRCRRA